MSASKGTAVRGEGRKAGAQISLRRRLPLLWLAVLLAGALFLPDRIWVTLLAGFGGLFLVAFFWAWLLAKGLDGGRRLRFGWVAVGDRLQEEFTLANNSDVPAPWIELIDGSSVPGYKAAVVRSLGPRESVRWRESAVCLRRGLFQLGPWALRSSDPFGIFTVTRYFSDEQEIIIHPPVHGDLALPLPQGQSSGRARARQRSWQARINAASVREYAPSDPYRWIHWPTSARRGTLHVRQFDLDTAGDIWILLDMQAEQQLAGGRAEGTEEEMILLAAALAVRALRQTRAVGLVAYGEQAWVLPPATGQGQQWRILRALALANAGGQAPLVQALRELSRTARRGAAAVIMTPSVSADWLPELARLSAKGVFSHVVLLDRASYGGEGAAAPVREAVRGLGFNADIVRQGEVGAGRADQERRGFWEFKVTGLGKVVAVRRPDEGEP